MTSIILKSCKQMTRITANLLKGSGDLSGRQYATLSDYKITWTRPEKPKFVTLVRSGDQGINVDIEDTDIPKIYRESPEMKDASDIVKRMFTLKFLPMKETRRIKRGRIISMVQRYDDDFFTPEARIAYLTSQIHILRDMYYKDPKNGRVKTLLKESIEKRTKLLAKLRKVDYRCFEYLLEKLNLVFKPLPSPPTAITKKESLTRLTEKHCDKIVQQKLNAYKAELKVQQKEFFAEKAEKLAFIREEEIANGLTPTVSKEEIALAKQRAMEC